MDVEMIPIPRLTCTYDKLTMLTVRLARHSFVQPMPIKLTTTNDSLHLLAGSRVLGRGSRCDGAALHGSELPR